MRRAVARVLRRVLVAVLREAAPAVVQMVWERWLSPCARLARAYVRRRRAYDEGRDVAGAWWSWRVRALEQACDELDAMPDGTCAKQVAERVAVEVIRGAVR